MSSPRGDDIEQLYNIDQLLIYHIGHSTALFRVLLTSEDLEPGYYMLFSFINAATQSVYVGMGFFSGSIPIIVC